MRPKKSEIVGAAIIIAFIIAVLGFGMYPTLRAAPGEQCLSNLQSVATALSLYAGDNWGHVPPGERWVDALSDEYVTDWRTLVCPEARPTAEEVAALQAAPGRPLPVGYSLFGPLAGRNAALLADPEATPWLFDSRPVQANSVAGINALATRHYGKTGNVFFADGSAKAMTEAPQAPSPVFRATEDDDHHDHEHGEPEQVMHEWPTHVHGPGCDH